MRAITLAVLIMSTMVVVRPAWAVSRKPMPLPSEAKQVPCAGSADLKVCVGFQKLDVLRLWGEPVAEWRDGQKDVHQMYDLGGVGCWLQYAGPDLHVDTIKCIGVEK